MARQKLGQHFLTAGSILDRIAAAACPEPSELVVEIGPGRGALTEKLLDRARRVVAVELDPALAEHLRRTLGRSGRLDVVEGNALAVNFGPWKGAPVAGNLPYYAASAIIGRVIRLRPPRAVFLIQKEVAQRLAARPGGRDYGYLTAATAVFAKVRLLFDVKPGAFRPPPKVDSAVALLEPQETVPEIGDEDAFLAFLSQAFRHKRKTLRNNLTEAYGDAVASWPEAGMRAEQLTLEQFAAMWRRVPGRTL